MATANFKPEKSKLEKEYFDETGLFSKIELGYNRDNYTHQYVHWLEQKVNKQPKAKTTKRKRVAKI